MPRINAIIAEAKRKEAKRKEARLADVKLIQEMDDSSMYNLKINGRHTVMNGLLMPGAFWKQMLKDGNL